MDIQDVDLMGQAHKRNPFPYFAQLRAEAPVFRTQIMGVGDVWLVTRYDDVVAVLRDKRLAKDPRNAGRKVREPDVWEIGIMSHNLLRFDDPAHTRLRTIAAKAFKQCGIAHLRDSVKRFTGEHLDAMASGQRAELVHDFASPIPLLVISELMGIPPEDHSRMPRWMEEATSPSGPPDMSVLSEFLRYLERLAVERQNAPKDDLLSALAQAEHDGSVLTTDELVATATAILIAGHETAVNLLGSGALTLMQSPEQRDRLLQNPDLAAPAVEELLRFSAPVESATERFAMEEIEMHGEIIPRGGVVLAVLASANRDADKFEDPDRLDIARDPNPHLAFGFGGHFCLGAPLAQMQAEIAIPGLFRRFPEIEPAVQQQRLRWKEMPILRGLETLPVHL